jgi:hypothetical protein
VEDSPQQLLGMPKPIEREIINNNKNKKSR